MTAPNRKDRLLSTDAREILNVTNPSIYDAAPRKGGYVNQQPPQMEGATTQTSKTRSKEEDDDDSQKGCPCKAIMEQQSDFVASFAYGAESSAPCTGPPLESLYKRSNFSRVDSTADTAGDRVSMLAIAISCVMLMASEYPRIPDEYLEHTKNYLDCIKDETEGHPPNIQGILKHINYLRDNGLVRPIGEESVASIPRGSVGIVEAEAGGEEGGDEEPAEEAAQRSRRPIKKGRPRSLVTPVPTVVRQKKK